jgi:hypothetical protein
MRIHAGDPVALPALINFMDSKPDLLVKQCGAQELAVTVRGSLHHDARRPELELRLRAWTAAHRDILSVKILPGD